MPSVQKLHDVEGRANYAAVLAEVMRLRHGDISRSQRMNDLVLALDPVRRFRKQLAGGLLAQHKLLSVGGRQLVRGVGLTEAELYKNC